MNAQNPPTPTVAYRDRSAGLMVFGILTILLGCLCVLFIAFMILGQMMSARTGAATANIRALIPAMGMYGFMAVALAWLGIGSIQARRWARALLLIFSWSWLIMGIVGLIFMVILLPQFLSAMQSATPSGQPGLPPAAGVMIMLFSLLFFSVGFIVLPAIWVFFYRSRHVKATCEARDPLVRWTDTCPLPVLALSLWLGLGALSMAAMPLSFNGVIPCFGMFLTGLPGSLLYLGLAAIWGYSAWAAYRLDARGWWLILVSLCLFSVSSAITYAQHDILELYRLMGYPEAQIEQLRKFNLFTGGLMVWGPLLFLLPVLGYLIYVKRYFRRAG